MSFRAQLILSILLFLIAAPVLVHIASAQRIECDPTLPPAAQQPQDDQPMAYDEQLADRVRAVLDPIIEASDLANSEINPLREIRMFGGLCFTIRGNMCIGVTDSALMLRLGKPGTAQALTEPHTRPMDFTGTPMSTMIYVDPDGIATKPKLQAWINRAIEFNATLPAK